MRRLGRRVAAFGRNGCAEILQAKQEMTNRAIFGAGFERLDSRKFLQENYTKIFAQKIDSGEIASKKFDFSRINFNFGEIYLKNEDISRIDLNFGEIFSNTILISKIEQKW